MEIIAQDKSVEVGSSNDNTLNYIRLKVNNADGTKSSMTMYLTDIETTALAAALRKLS